MWLFWYLFMDKLSTGWGGRKVRRRWWWFTVNTIPDPSITKSCVVLDTIGRLSSGSITQFSLEIHDSYGWSIITLPTHTHTSLSQSVIMRTCCSIDFVDLTKGYLYFFFFLSSSILKAAITVRNQKMLAHSVKVTFPISANYSKFSEVQYTVAQPDITHQQERQIPALRDSCFMPGITNWIVWGSVIYLNAKMQSYSLFILWSLNPRFKINLMLCRKMEAVWKTQNE